MRISRIFVSRVLSPNREITLEGDAAHYIRNVLRLRKHDTLRLFDGSGGEFRAELLLVSRKQVRVRVGEWTEVLSESPLRLNLAIGISRGERMDFVIQKSVELGVAGIRPLVTERSVVRLDAGRALQKMEHWQRIAQNACEQCGRDTVPQVEEPVRLNEWIADTSGHRYFMDPRATTGFAQPDAKPAEILLLCGPEGGFSSHERDLAETSGFTGVSLGPRILRTETAVLAGMAVIQSLWGDLG